MRVMEIQYRPQVYRTAVSTKHISKHVTLNTLNYLCIVYLTMLFAADYSTVNYCTMRSNKLECMWKEPE